jgi:hypothetical protein
LLNSPFGAGGQDREHARLLDEDLAIVGDFGRPEGAGSRLGSNKEMGNWGESA